MIVSQAVQTGEVGLGKVHAALGIHDVAAVEARVAPAAVGAGGAVELGAVVEADIVVRLLLVLGLAVLVVLGLRLPVAGGGGLAQLLRLLFLDLSLEEGLQLLCRRVTQQPLIHALFL